MSLYDEIGEEIVDLRKQRGYTQERLALECGISPSYLRLIEHGDANPTVGELVRIADVLGVKLVVLFTVPALAGATH